MTRQISVGNSRLELVRGDITQQDTDAIVNAANKELAPGGGVAGAIHRAAGPALWDEAKTLGGCNTGEAKITKGYNLAAKFVIHTVGPVFSGTDEDARMLRSCYGQSLTLADSHSIKSIAFPAISTGIFGYPIRDAAIVSLDTVFNYLESDTAIELVRFVLFVQNDYDVFSEILERLV
jgi:O-acetyl-ADP-ribose deacetylase